MSAKNAGGISLIGVIVLVLGVTLLGGVNYPELIASIISFLSGDLASVPNGADETLQNIVLIVLATIVIKLSLSFVGLTYSYLAHGATKSHDLSSLEKLMDKGPFVFFILMLSEEIVARLIPLGLLTQIFKGHVAFYLLLLTGNLTWAAMHLKNFENVEDRKWSRVIPQFLGGLILAYLFVRYGFWTTLMAHYVFDAVLFSGMKEKPVTKVQFKVAVYHGCVFVVSWLLMIREGLSFNTLEPWFQSSNGLSQIPGLTFANLVLIIIWVDNGLELLSSILMLDRPDVDENVTNIGFMLFGLALAPAIILLVNWISHFFVTDAVTRTVMVVIILSMMARTTSGSMLARLWLINPPIMFITVSVTTIFGFRYAVVMYIVMELINYIPTLWRLKMQNQEVQNMQPV